MAHWICAFIIAFIVLVVIPAAKHHGTQATPRSSRNDAYELGRQAGGGG